MLFLENGPRNRQRILIRKWRLPENQGAMASPIFWLHQDSSSKTHQIPILSLQLHLSVGKITRISTLLYSPVTPISFEFRCDFLIAFPELNPISTLLCLSDFAEFQAISALIFGFFHISGGIAHDKVSR